MTTVLGETAIKAALNQKLITPQMSISEDYMDADDELQIIERFLEQSGGHQASLEEMKIKYLYTTLSKKEGGRFVIGSLALRSAIERAVDDSYNYIVTVYYPVWKDLDEVSKAVQLDRILRGVEEVVKNDGTKQLKKKAVDSREYVENMNLFGADRVLNISETVHLACESIDKAVKKAKKEGVEVNFDEYQNDGQFA